jgi:hypothetical protein
LKQKPEAVAERPAESPPTKPLECDPATYSALATAWNALDAAETELRQAGNALANLSREHGRLAVLAEKAKIGRFRELIGLFAKGPDIALGADPTAADLLRLAIVSGTFDYCREYFHPQLQRIAMRRQAGVLKAQGAVVASVISYRKVHLYRALEHLTELEGPGVQLPASGLETTKLETLQMSLQTAAYRLEQQADDFELKAAQGQKRQGAYDSYLPLQSKFKSLFYRNEGVTNA